MSEKSASKDIVKILEATKITSELPLLIEAEEQKVSVRDILLAKIAPDPKQPRKNFKDAELKELASSIREQGLLQPILAS